MNEDNEIVHIRDGKWYFWDETWSNRIGPYSSENEAQKALKEYIETFLS